MWFESGTEINARWSALHPQRVLYDFDGPRIFTCLDEHGETWFAYQCDEQAALCVFLLVPFSEELEERLTRGNITILKALRQPRLWVAQTDHEFSISRLFKSKLDDVPRELLPRPEAMLWSHLQPLLNLRGIGKENTFIQHSGTIRAFDRDKMTVRVHTDGKDVVFEIEDVESDLTDRAIEALQGEYEIVASGERKGKSSKLVLQAIHKK